MSSQHNESQQNTESQHSTNYQVTNQLRHHTQYGSFPLPSGTYDLVSPLEQGQATMEVMEDGGGFPLGPAVPSGYPAHALPGNIGTTTTTTTTRFPVFPASSETSESSDLDSQQMRPNNTTELPGDQFTFNPVFAPQQYPFYQTGEQQYFSQPCQTYQSSQVHFTQSNQVYEGTPQGLVQSPEFQYQQSSVNVPTFRSGVEMNPRFPCPPRPQYTPVPPSVFPVGVEPHCQNMIRPGHHQAEGWHQHYHQPKPPVIQDFTAPQNVSFGPEMLVRIPENNFVTSAGGGGGGQTNIFQAQSVSYSGSTGSQLENYPDSYNSTEKPKQSPDSVLDSGPEAPLSQPGQGNLPAEVAPQHSVLTDHQSLQTFEENVLNSQINSENVNKGIFKNKEMFKQVVYNQECDDQTRSSSQTQQMSNQMAEVPVLTSSQYDVMRSNPRFDGENNNIQQPPILVKGAREGGNPAFQKPLITPGMTMVPGLSIPQMTGGQPMMVPQSPDPSFIMRHPSLTSMPEGPTPSPPVALQRFVRPPAAQPGLVPVRCPPPPLNYTERSQAGVPLVVTADKVSVPWGWKRVFMGEQVVYFR